VVLENPMYLHVLDTFVCTHSRLVTINLSLYDIKTVITDKVHL